MKMSTKCRYGLRALADLSLEGGSSPVPLGQIAQRQKISLKYLEQEFATLRKAGLVRSVKGAQGGYSLAMPATSIMISDVIKLLEGDMLLVDEQQLNDNSITPVRKCINDNLWVKLNNQVQKDMESFSLADLISSWQEGNEENPMYYI